MARPRILIIDERVDSFGVLGDTLSDLAELAFAVTGLEGIDRAQAWSPDLVLLALNTADIDGFQVLETLRSARTTASLPVIFLIDRTDAEAESRALVRGAADLIYLPLRAEVLRSRVRLHLNLRQQAAELHVLNTAMDERVEQRSQEIAQALHRAESSARARTSFLARISHELRTPLGTVIGLAQVGLRDAAAGLPAEPHYVRILATAQQLLGMVSDVIDFSRLEDGLLTVQRQSLDLTQTVAQAVQQVEPAAAAKGLTMQVTWEAPDHLAIIGDARRIEQVLVHLLSNAVKFTDAGHVHLSVRETPQQVHFEVSDTGIGMSAEQLDALAHAQEPLDDSGARVHGGLGLGLLISRHLAVEMGGKIEVNSLPGEGTEVRFILMKSHAGELPASPTAKTSSGRLEGLRVLAVEDIEINRFLLTRILRQEGASFELADNGRDAIAAVQRCQDSGNGEVPFDAVLMDVQMPLMDGYEATQRLRLKAPDLPVIGLTAHALPEERARCLASGMTAHLAKPVDVDELVGTLLRACGRQVPDWRSTAAAGRDSSSQDPGGRPPAPALRRPARHRRARRRPTSEHLTLPLASPGPVVDWEALALSLGASQAFINQLAQALIRNLQAKPDALRAAALTGDHDAIRREAHAIKGIAANVKAHDAHDLAQKTESAAREGELQALQYAQDLAAEVSAMIESARALLEA